MGEWGERKSCRETCPERDRGEGGAHQSPAQGLVSCLFSGRASCGQERQGPRKSPVLGWAGDGGHRPPSRTTAGIGLRLGQGLSPPGSAHRA